jgi:hypothetical protein
VDLETSKIDFSLVNKNQGLAGDATDSDGGLSLPPSRAQQKPRHADAKNKANGGAAFKNPAKPTKSKKAHKKISKR